MNFNLMCVMQKLMVSRLYLILLLPIMSYSQSIEHIEDFQSKYIQLRNIDVLLPLGYSQDSKYNVLYMHDGQMLFDSTSTWNGQEWRVDETILKLQQDNRIKPTIVVAISNIPELRFAEYFPQKGLSKMSEPIQALIKTRQFNSDPLADAYLKFLVEELKPYIDNKYSVYRDKEHTFIMGSSMGGLISLYALCEYPNVFSGAACLSMHSPMLAPPLFDNIDIDSDVAKPFRDYLKESLPSSNSCKLYIDYGDQGLDAYYDIYQSKIDELLVSLGWKYPYWKTKFFAAEDHSERAWAKRLYIPLEFMLGN